MTDSVITLVFVTSIIFSTVLCYPAEILGDEVLPNIRKTRSPQPYCPDCDNPSPPNNPLPIPNNPPPIPNNPSPPPNNHSPPSDNLPPPPNNPPLPPNHLPPAPINPFSPPDQASPPPNNLSSPCGSASAHPLPSNGGSPGPCATGASALPKASRGSGGDQQNVDARLVPAQFQQQQYGGANLNLTATLAANFGSSFSDAGLHSSTNNPVAPISRKVCLFCKIYDSS